MLLSLIPGHLSAYSTVMYKTLMMTQMEAIHGLKNMGFLLVSLASIMLSF